MKIEFSRFTASSYSKTQISKINLFKMKRILLHIDSKQAYRIENYAKKKNPFLLPKEHHEKSILCCIVKSE